MSQSVVGTALGGAGNWGQVTVSGYPLAWPRCASRSHGRQPNPARVLEEIKRLAVEQLGGVPNAACTRRSKTRCTIPRSAAGTAVAASSMQALVKLRQQNATYVMRYRQQIAQGFDDFRALRIRSRGDLPLSLVAENQLDFHLAGQQLAEAIGQRYRAPLEMHRTAAWRALADALQVPPASNPIGARPPGRRLHRDLPRRRVAATRCGR